MSILFYLNLKSYSVHIQYVYSSMYESKHTEETEKNIFLYAESVDAIRYNVSAPKQNTGQFQKSP